MVKLSGSRCQLLAPIISGFHVGDLRAQVHGLSASRSSYLLKLLRTHGSIERDKIPLLDGLEPLQSDVEFKHGAIKDPGLKTLLLELSRENSGLCVITTREPVSDLMDERFADACNPSSAQTGSGWCLSGVLAAWMPPSSLQGGINGVPWQVPPRPTLVMSGRRVTLFADAVIHKDLEQVSTLAGRTLLRVQGIKGNDEQLERTVEQFGNHALAVNLLASYLTEVADRDIEHAAVIPVIEVSEPVGKHPRHVVAALERHLAHQPKIELLRILGSFERPTTQEEISAVLAKPAIPHLTDRLMPLSNDQYAAVL